MAGFGGGYSRNGGGNNDIGGKLVADSGRGDNHSTVFLVELGSVDGGKMKRDKSLKQMTIYELIDWLGKLCKLWTSERSQLSLHFSEIEKEIERTMVELLSAFKHLKQCEGINEQS